LSAPAPALAASQAVIDRFLDALWLEDGLARNTLAAYRRDLALFADWLAREEARELAHANATDVQRDMLQTELVGNVVQ